MAKKEIVSYGGKDYTLEFTRKTVSMAERDGFKIGEIAGVGGMMGMLLIQYAFQANHPNLNVDKRFEIYRAWRPEPDESGKKRNRLEILVDMYVDSIKWLYDDGEDENPTEEVAK